MCTFTSKYDDLALCCFQPVASKAAVEEPSPPGLQSSRVFCPPRLDPGWIRFDYGPQGLGVEISVIGLWRAETRCEISNAKCHLHVWQESSLNVVWQEWCPIAGQDFTSLEGFTHNPMHSVDPSQLHVNIERTEEDSLFDRWQIWWTMAARCFCLWLQSVCRTKKNSDNSDLTWSSFNHSRPPLCVWLILQKVLLFLHVLCLNFPSLLLDSANTQLGQTTLSVKCEL